MVPPHLLLTANRRLLFSASRKLARDNWTADENERIYGAGRERHWGAGANYAAFVVFDGPIDPLTHMLVNLTTVKETIGAWIDERYDHKFLNVDTPPFDRLPPTPELVARELLSQAGMHAPSLSAHPCACRLMESPVVGATAYASGVVEREYWLAFSAARRTCSPHLSERENLNWFGRAALAEGHGHGYQLRLVLRGPLDETTGMIAPHAEVARVLSELHDRLDHRHLNVSLAEMASQPMTTECLARFIFDRTARLLPVTRVRLHETPEFFAEYNGSRAALGLARSFSAAHCLRRNDLSDALNRRLFGKCSNPSGHGHRYLVEATISGAIDERTGTLARLDTFEAALAGVLDPWDQRHLDRDIEAFGSALSTGENIVRLLWPALNERLDGRLTRLRLSETENNRFTLRRRGES